MMVRESSSAGLGEGMEVEAEEAVNRPHFHVEWH